MDLVKILLRQRNTLRTRIPECDANGSIYVIGGVGGVAATIADGADIAQGALADVEVAVAGPASVIAILKRIRTLLNGGLPASLGQKTKAASLPVTLASDEDALAVTGAFFQVTQPVSLAVAPSTPVTGPIDIEVGGVAPQLDDTDKIAVSVYGEDAAAGDTPLPVDATYGVRVCHPNATSGTVDADPDTNNAPLTDVGNVLRYWTRGFVFNGTTWDRMRGDTTGVFIGAAENPIGLVGSHGINILQTPTITAGLYSAGDAVGGLLTFAGAARVATYGGVLKNVLIFDDAGQDASMELWLFSETFVAMADNAPWAPSEADLRNLVAIIPTSDGAWFAAGTPSVARIEVSQYYKCAATSLFGQLVTRGTPTYAATDDVTVIIGLLQD